MAALTAPYDSRCKDDEFTSYSIAGLAIIEGLPVFPNDDTILEWPNGCQVAQALTGFGYTLRMKTVTDEQARTNLPLLLEQAAASHEPIQITGRNVSAVLVAEEDWRSIEETLYLLSVPGMRASIQEGMKTPVEECSTELPW